MSAQSANQNGCSSPQQQPQQPQQAAQQQQPPSSENGSVHLKILIPSIAAGAIIGKGGETIAELQKQAGARVKMSKANDFYPGTNERVCLISGPPEAVMTILEFVGDKIREKPDPNAKPAIDFDNKVQAEREKQVKIIVPNSTAGMVIGKGGAFIKQVKDDSGAFIQISQKSKDVTLPERVITIIGDKGNTKKALELIINKIQDDPQSASCLNISYTEVQGLVANPNPTGSPYVHNGHEQAGVSGVSVSGGNVAPAGGGGRPHQLHVPPHPQQPHAQPNHHPHHHPHQPQQRPVQPLSPYMIPNGGGPPGALATPPNVNLGLRFNFTHPGRPHLEPTLMSATMQQLNMTLRSQGYSKAAVEEIVRSVSSLATHGVLDVMNPAGGSPMDNGAMPPIGDLMGGLMRRPMPGEGGPPVDMNMANDVAAAHRGGPAGGPWVNHAGGGPAANKNMDQHHSNQLRKRAISPSASAATSSSPNKNSFGLAVNNSSEGKPSGSSPAGGSQVEIEVNENMIGAIIGPSGKSIVDIQQFSGARIQVSKKGTFSPGTRNRIVTISGNPQAIASARSLIDRKVKEEERKRSY